jgi:hypothetical protein
MPANGRWDLTWFLKYFQVLVRWGSVTFLLSPVKLCVVGLRKIAVSWTICLLYMSLHGSVSIVTKLLSGQLRKRSSIPGKEAKFFLSTASRPIQTPSYPTGGSSRDFLHLGFWLLQTQSVCISHFSQSIIFNMSAPSPLEPNLYTYPSNKVSLLYCIL